MSEPPKISQRKSDHIEVAASGRADFRNKGTLLDNVHLVHQALPERRVDAIDLQTEIAGHTLLAPIFISGMTGGAEEASAINRDLARAAEKLGIGFGVGSQRAMAERPELEHTFLVRDVAPNVFLVGNLGVVQAKELGVDRCCELVKRLGANALAIHLNPAMELIQAHGDRDFSSCLDTIAKLVDTLPVPVIVKETGCGLSAEVARAVVKIGVRTVDVSGSGGTSWVAVEAERAAAGSDAESLGQELWDWGIPTAVSAALCSKAGLEVIATGGIRSGYDIARALALGATAGGLAAPALRAQQAGGYDAVVALLERIRNSVQAITLLSGIERSRDLVTAPKHLAEPLRTWLKDLG